ncbi:hypothetical protein HY633_03065 [Candidatus Uhrbacteria bacterium]|nr:hypothetical protein [Candidatus Uhrbacteria bacterium]
MHGNLRILALKLAAFVFAAGCLVSVTWALGIVMGPKPRFVGSPPRTHAVQRNDLDLDGDHADFLEHFVKAYRPSGYFDPNPGLIATPLVHHLQGWDVYADGICVRGVIKTLNIEPTDGDINFDVDLDDETMRYSWRRTHPEDEGVRRRILVEIDDPIRPNFPILPDLAIGDLVKVCGRWVYDRSHDHNEVHPARWVEILQEAVEPP